MSDTDNVAKRIEVDHAAIARKIVRTGFQLEPGQVLAVHGLVEQLEFLEELCLATREIGAFPVLTANSEGFKRRVFERVSEEHLSRPPKHMERWMEDVPRVYPG